MNKEKMMKILKIILIILLVIIVIVLINTFRKFMIVKGLKNNSQKYTLSKNYHIKATSNEITTNSYKKDDKELIIMEKDEKEKISVYNTGNKKDIFYDTSEGKKAELNSNTTLTSREVYDYFDSQTDFQLFFASILPQVKRTEYNGKECYKLKNFFTLKLLWGNEINEVYIEKDTGLVVKENIDDVISEIEYEFDNVSDEMFIQPDSSKYKIIKK